jgi:hypothetical protein
MNIDDETDLVIPSRRSERSERRTVEESALGTRRATAAEVIST